MASRAAGRGRETVIAALIDATAALLAEEGPARISLRGIADRAGVNKGQIHHYFGSKQALIEAAVRQLATEHYAETMLALVDHTNRKVVAVDQTGLDRLDPLLDLPAPIRPAIYSAVDDFGHGHRGTPLMLTNDEQRTTLMGDAAYLVLGENSVVIGRYDRGREAELIADYRRVHRLVTHGG